MKRQYFVVFLNQNTLKLIRILAVDSPKFTGVTYWRNLRPLTELQRKYTNLQIKFVSEEVPVFELMQADVVIMFRPITPKSLQFIENCKSPLLNIKVIIDIDDNLWRLPPGHPAENDYNEAAQTLRKIYSLADGVWCSTDPLMDFADARDGRGVVVANAVLERDLPAHPSPYKGHVCWRGTSEQMADICSPEAVAEFEANKDRFRRWFFWGWQPGQLRGANTQQIGRVDPLVYMAGLANAGINLMWKPLQENQFNDAKSNIAWIEATLAGGVCVTNYAHKPGWEMAIDHFTDNADFIASQWQASRDWIIEHYNLEKVNAIRYAHILKTLDGK